jgi:predicted dehydrogenase
MSDTMLETGRAAPPAHARLGLVGAGRSALHFLRALTPDHAFEVVARCPAPGDAATDIALLAPRAAVVRSFDELLAAGVEGVLISCPTAARVEQAIAAAERGIAVFCQRPVGRDAAETRRVIAAARRANVLLGVDMSLRLTDAMRILRSTVQAGELGDIYAVDLVYHNANGPAHEWARNVTLSGGGCVMDSGISMIDIALWTLGFPRVTGVTSRLFARGERIEAGSLAAEDYATALIELDTGVTVNMSSAWNLPIGQNARIAATFYGTEGGGTLRNINGSYYDFISELFHGTHRHALTTQPDNWLGRAEMLWADGVARGDHYDPWVEGVADVATVVDRILGKHTD